ncbi:MAG: hypothetical protein M3332_13075 [Actinomycetota bacterium]|nr:hypothetical protein [Actinomycetota bacterium]
MERIFLFLLGLTFRIRQVIVGFKRRIMRKPPGRPGARAVNRSGRPERILSPGETRAFARMVEVLRRRPPTDRPH